MKILITGGCGFVGSNLAIFLKKRIKNANVLSLDNLIRKGSEVNEKRLKREKITNLRIDVSNSKKIGNLRRFNLIIDCCAEPAIEASKKNPDQVFNTNLVGTYNILKKCIKDKSNIIFLSSSRVYSIKSLKRLIKNLDLKRPLKIDKTIDERFETDAASSLYGFTKLASEKLIKEFFYEKKMKYIINRFGVIAGPWQFGKQDQGFVPLWVARHFFKKKLSYIGFGGEGHQVRDIIHINDVCRIILLQIKKINKINNLTFNIGGGFKNYTSLKNLTNKCIKLTGNKVLIKKVKRTSNYDIPYYITNNSKIFKTYRWKPEINLDKTLKDIYSWLVKNNMRDYFK